MRTCAHTHTNMCAYTETEYFLFHNVGKGAEERREGMEPLHAAISLAAWRLKWGGGVLAIQTCIN